MTGRIKPVQAGAGVAERRLDDALREVRPLRFVGVGVFIAPVLEILESVELLRERPQGSVGGQGGLLLNY